MWVPRVKRKSNSKHRKENKKPWLKPSHRRLSQNISSPLSHTLLEVIPPQLSPQLYISHIFRISITGAGMQISVLQRVREMRENSRATDKKKWKTSANFSRRRYLQPWTEGRVRCSTIGSNVCFLTIVGFIFIGAKTQSHNNQGITLTLRKWVSPIVHYRIKVISSIVLHKPFRSFSKVSITRTSTRCAASRSRVF